MTEVERNTKYIEELNNKIKNLKAEIDEYNEIIYNRDLVSNLIVGKQPEQTPHPFEDNEEFYRFRIGFFDKEKIKKFNEENYNIRWKDSVYCKHQIECEKLTTCSFEAAQLEVQLKRFTDSPFRRIDDISVKDTDRRYTFTIVCYLDSAIPTENGYVLILSDPFDTIISYPVDEQFSDLIEQIVGQAVVVALSMNYYDEQAIVKNIAAFTI